MTRIFLVFISLCGIFNESFCHIKDVQHKVQCSEDKMRIIVALSGNDHTYLDGLNGYKNEKCEPKVGNNQAIYDLSLVNFYECGVTTVVNKKTGKQTFYHTIVLEKWSGEAQKVAIKCTLDSNSTRTKSSYKHAIGKRDILPVGFTEPEDLEISTDVVGKAPEPILSVGVKQNNSLISENLNVSPGTPLVIEISLDRVSAEVYGLSVSQMQVTDTKTQEEIIIYNGCSVDPYLFENFRTENGDHLSAKFRAFKFPDSSYVQFKVVVNVCLDKCDGTECSNGQIGYGRRRREIRGTNTKNLYEIHMSTFIKVDYETDADKTSVHETDESINKLKLANQKLNRASRGNIPSNVSDNLRNDDAKVEETGYSTRRNDLPHQNHSTSSSTALQLHSLIVLLAVVIGGVYHW